MGLDSVELVLDFEATFQIEIPDREAEKMLTPAHVIDFICRELGISPSAQDHAPRILSAENYGTKVGKALTQLLPKVDVTQLSRLEALFPGRSERKRRWIELRDALQARCWPSLSWLGMGAGFPADLETVGDLTEWLRQGAALPFSTAERSCLSRQDVAEVVKAIVIRQIGVSEAIYAEHKRFIEDLGVDWADVQEHQQRIWHPTKKRTAQAARFNEKKN
jgi:acyl carrier protein